MDLFGPQITQYSPRLFSLPKSEISYRKWLFLWSKPVSLTQAEGIFQVRVSRPACQAPPALRELCLCSHLDAPCLHFPLLLSMLSPAAACLSEPVPGHLSAPLSSTEDYGSSAHTLLLRLWVMVFAVPAITIWEPFNCIFHSAWIKGEEDIYLLWPGLWLMQLLILSSITQSSLTSQGCSVGNMSLHNFFKDRQKVV